MDFQERIGSCRYFAVGACPHQPLMERAYLIPQLMDRSELLRCERVLCPCDHEPASRAKSIDPGIINITFHLP
jgi:hypothetical protein